MPGQAYTGDLDAIQKANILKVAAVPPGDTARRIVAENGGLGIFGILPERNGFLVSLDLRCMIDLRTKLNTRCRPHSESTSSLR